jgi:hypothetical protein
MIMLCKMIQACMIKSSKTGQWWLVCWTSSSVGRKHTPHLSSSMFASLRRIDASLIEEQEHLSWIPAGGIYIIGEIVFHMELTTINSEGYFGSAPTYDINEQWRLIEHIDVVVRTGDSKKIMPDPIVMRSNSFKDDCIMFDVLPCKLALPTY